MTNDERFSPLPKADVIAAVEGKNPSRVPLVRAKWWGEGLAEQYGAELDRFDRIPEDVVQLFTANPVDPVWDRLEPEAERAHREDRYLLYSYWNLFFERPWKIRGMENLMVDYYTERENVERLHRAMADQYARYLREARHRLEPDGYFTSDDLGHQTGPMMSPAIFHELIYPHYCTVARTAHECGMHFWLHSCGDNTLLLPDLIDAGVDVFHPVQKHTMDEVETMRAFGGRLAFLAGIDVQHVLQEADPDGVREEVRFLIDTFDRPEGRMCIAAGNGIVSGTPIENIEAFLDEALRYGTEHRRRSTPAPARLTR